MAVVDLTLHTWDQIHLTVSALDTGLLFRAFFEAVTSINAHPRIVFTPNAIVQYANSSIYFTLLLDPSRLHPDILLTNILWFRRNSSSLPSMATT